MENDQKLLELLERIEKTNRRQVWYARFQFLFTVIAAAACVVLLVSALGVFPQLEDAVSQAETVLNNLESVTTELAKSDLSGMVENMDTLVTNVDGLVNASQTGVEQAIENLNSIDFDALNGAIKDLSDVIEPIAKFFKSFKIG